MHTTLFELMVTASRRERIMVGSLHVLATVAPWQADMAWFIKIMLGLCVLVSWVVWKPPEPVRVRASSDGSLQVFRESVWQTAEIRGESRITPMLTMLVLVVAGQVIRVRIWPDSVSEEDFRRVRVWLRHWAAHPTQKDKG